jgi:hypothetical protein
MQQEQAATAIIKKWNRLVRKNCRVFAGWVGASEADKEQETKADPSATEYYSTESNNKEARRRRERQITHPIQEFSVNQI